MACLEPQQLHICVVDTAELVRASTAEADGGGVPVVVVNAVCRLQALGFKVILLVDNAEKLQFGNLYEDDGVNCEALYVKSRRNDDCFEVIRVAAEYNCVFVSNMNCGVDCAGHWLLPRGFQEWLTEAWPDLHACFALDSQGELQLQMRGKLLQHHHRLQHSRNAFFAAADARRAMSALKGLHGSDTVSAPAEGRMTALERQEETPAVGESQLEVGLDLQGAGEGASDMAQTWAVDLQLESPTGCVLGVPRQNPLPHPEYVEKLLCLHCSDTTMSMFQQAVSISCEVLGVRESHFEELDNEDPVLGQCLAARGGMWAWEHYIVLMVTSGQFCGLRAVGLGSKKKKRLRAAHMALAATAGLCIPGFPPPNMQADLTALFSAVETAATRANAMANNALHDQFVPGVPSPSTS